MPPPMFDFEFKCIGVMDGGECIATIHGKCYLAVAEGAGYEFACIICGQQYNVKTDGAHPVEPATEEQTFVDAAGKPFVLSTWEMPVVGPKL